MRREAGLLPPGVTKRIGQRRGWTLWGGVPVGRFRVEGGRLLRYVGWPVRDELVPRSDGSWEGRGLLLGFEFCRFRLEPL